MLLIEVAAKHVLKIILLKVIIMMVFVETLIGVIAICVIMVINIQAGICHLVMKQVNIFSNNTLIFLSLGQFKSIILLEFSIFVQPSTSHLRLLRLIQILY